MTRSTRSYGLGLALVAAAVLAGCSADDTISRSDIEEQVDTQLTETVGQAPDDVSCPGDLDAEVGATTTCVLTADGQAIDVTVEVTETDGDEYRLAIVVADEPN